MKEIVNVGVIGAGQMGAGIAQVSAAAGFTTVLWDLSKDLTDRAVKGIDAQLARLVEKQKIPAASRENTLKNLKGVDSITDLKSCDLVIEAVTENFEVKAKIFRELDEMLGAHAILASNTSSISITKIAGATKRPTQVMGMHFMNPVPLMKLVELIRGLQTSDATFTAIKTVSEKMGKTVVSAKDSAGFTVNRILVPMVNEAIYLLQEGNKPEDIDQAMVLGTNQPMGPLALADLVGLDTLYFIAQVLHRELGEDKYRPCPLLAKYVEAGWYGRKTKRGFYTYE
jgi:3-hydroxybutyryl-CoA dehydrogenase